MEEFTTEELEVAGLDPEEAEALGDEPETSEEETEPVEEEQPEAPEPDQPEELPEIEETPEPVKEEAPSAEPWFRSDREGFNKPATDQAQTAINGVEAEIKLIHAKLDEGEVSITEHADEAAKLYDQRSEINRRLSRERELNENYCDALDSFFTRPENAVFEDSKLFSLLNSQVQRIAKENPRMDDIAILEAGRAVLVDMEVRGLRDGTTSDPGKKPKAKTPEHSQKTLGDVSAAAPEDTGDNSKFAHLQGLDGDALESKLAAMSDNEIQAYLDETAP